MVKVVPEHEGFFAADDAGDFQFGGDAAGGVAGTQHDEGLRVRLDGSQHGPGEPARAAERRDENEPDNLAHDELSLDDRWKTRAT